MYFLLGAAYCTFFNMSAETLQQEMCMLYLPLLLKLS